MQTWILDRGHAWEDVNSGFQAPAGVAGFFRLKATTPSLPISHRYSFASQLVLDYGGHEHWR